MCLEAATRDSWTSASVVMGYFSQADQGPGFRHGKNHNLSIIGHSRSGGKIWARASASAARGRMFSAARGRMLSVQELTYSLT